MPPRPGRQKIAPSDPRRRAAMPGAEPGWRGRACDLSGVHVLVVDDDLDARTMLRQVLAHLGASVSAEGSAESALASLRDARPHLIITDLAMPGRGGCWLIQQVRARPGGNAIPIIAVTAYGAEYPAQQVREVGGDAFLRKPIDIDMLAAVVARFSGR